VAGLDTTETGAVRFDGAITELQGVSQGLDGKEVRILNRSGSAFIVRNLSGSAASIDQIDTGTGSDISISEGGVLILRYDGASQLWGIAGGSGGSSPDVVEGPASATDNAIARFDGTTGKLIQNSGSKITDSGAILSAEQATPITGPAVESNFGTFYPGDDNMPYYKSDLTSSQGIRLDKPQIINYILNGYVGSSASGYIEYTDTAGTAPVTGAGGGGAAANVNFGFSTSTPVRGTHSFTFDKLAGNGQGRVSAITLALIARIKPKFYKLATTIKFLREPMLLAMLACGFMT
jgi:hypothetical protein